MHRRVGVSDAEFRPTFSITPGQGSIAVPSEEVHSEVSDEYMVDEALIQRRAPSDWRLVMTGSAQRIGHRITSDDIPYIETIGGQRATRLNQRTPIELTSSGYIGKCPVYSAKWRIEYAVPKHITEYRVVGEPENTSYLQKQKN